MSEARIGWGGEVQLSSSSSAAGLVELSEVVSFGLPDDQADEVEVTHLKSPDKRKEFISGLTDGGEVEVSLNYVPGGTTDILVRDAKDSGDTRAVRFIIPDELGVAEWQITTACFVKGYSRGPVSAGEKIAATIRLRITGAQNEAAETNEADS